MIRVQPGSIETLADLRGALQSAIQLEHATIPPYLTAFFTLKGTGDGARYAAQTLHDVFMEEMLHMHLAANILNAVGGRPAINDPAFIPDYPGPLPMGIGSGRPGGLTVGIKRYSKQTVKKTFMEIEEPEDKLDLPTRESVRKSLFTAAPPTTYETIGEFYHAIAAAITRLGESIFTGDPGLQVPGAIQVADVASAIEAITTIITQGEGTSTSPADGDPGDELAHYYRYQQLYRGMKIVPDPSAPDKYAFDPKQPIIVDDMADVIQMADNPATVTLDPTGDWRAIQLSDEFDSSYTRLLNCLHIAFNGDPDRINDAIAIMYELKNSAEELLQQQLSGAKYKGQFAGPRFRYAGP
ncbi:MAG: ferritin-like protein [Allosphingosinicella sp.]